MFVSGATLRQRYGGTVPRCGSYTGAGVPCLHRLELQLHSAATIHRAAGLGNRAGNAGAKARTGRRQPQCVAVYSAPESENRGSLEANGAWRWPGVANAADVAPLGATCV